MTEMKAMDWDAYVAEIPFPQREPVADAAAGPYLAGKDGESPSSLAPRFRMSNPDEADLLIRFGKARGHSREALAHVRLAAFWARDLQCELAINGGLRLSTIRTVVSLISRELERIDVQLARAVEEGR